MYIKCKKCGKEFKIFKCRRWVQKYCSKECRFENLEWRKVWRLTVMWNQKKKNGVVYEECLCDCWNRKWIPRRLLLHGDTISCWCYRAEVARESWKRNKKHWMRWTRMYRIYMCMNARCNDIHHDNYSFYWGRWIKVCRNTFEEFMRDMWESYKQHVEIYWEKDTTIDRINSNWNYCKENCRWATMLKQQNNKRSNKYVEYKWEVMSISDLCRKYNIPYSRTRERISKWWPIKDAVELPIVPQRLHKKWINFIIKYLRKCEKKN